MKLTWNQRRALENLSYCPNGAPPRGVADQFCGIYPYLCGATARSALVALNGKGLVDCFGSPLRYRITDAGRRALEESRDEAR